MTLLEYLHAAGISQVAFARQLGVPVSTLHGWGNGRRLPTATKLAAIERATGGKVTARDFVPAPGGCDPFPSMTAGTAPTGPSTGPQMAADPAPEAA